MQKKTWVYYEDNAADAGANHIMDSFFYQMGFILGTVMLSTGAVVVAFYGEGGERIVCWIVLSILTFSVFVGGMAWVESTTSSMANIMQMGR